MKQWLTNTWSRRTSLVLALAVIASLLLAACGSAATDPAPNASDTGTRTISAGAQATTTRQATPRATRTPSLRATATPTRSATRPVGSPTPIPPPPPAIGDTVQTEGFEITVDSFDLYGTVGAFDAKGVFLYLRMTVANANGEAKPFPFDGLVVIDMNNTSYFLAEAPTRESLTYDFGFELDQPLPPGESRQVTAVFDIASDATGLILTSPSRAFEIRLEYGEAPK